jgi:hypothetical protein
MSVRIQLDNPHQFYTNLDFISGRVILNLTNDETVSAITVKLEGESKTVLMRPMGPQYQANGPLYSRRDQRQGLASENHKVLYRMEMVFPSPGTGIASGYAYTLRAGQHEYPFRIKIPFNNSCGDPQALQIGPGNGFGGLGLNGLQQMSYRHVKKTLPPSLTGFPGEAEIRYYIKATVQRPSIFKENRRSAIGFKFLPLENPRPPLTQNETFARRPYVFQSGLASFAEKSSMFKKKKSTPLSDTAPRGEVDARLPSPPILTCLQPVPLRLIFKKNDLCESRACVSYESASAAVRLYRRSGPGCSQDGDKYMGVIEHERTCSASREAGRSSWDTDCYGFKSLEPNPFT